MSEVHDLDGVVADRPWTGSRGLHALGPHDNDSKVVVSFVYKPVESYCSLKARASREIYVRLALPTPSEPFVGSSHSLDVGSHPRRPLHQ